MIVFAFARPLAYFMTVILTPILRGVNFPSTRRARRRRRRCVLLCVCVPARFVYFCLSNATAGIIDLEERYKFNVSRV